MTEDNEQDPINVEEPMSGSEDEGDHDLLAAHCGTAALQANIRPRKSEKALRKYVRSVLDSFSGAQRYNGAVQLNAFG